MSLIRGARTAVRQCMNIKKGETVLVLTDTRMPKEIAEALIEASKEVTERVDLKTMEPLERDGQEPSEEIAELMKTPDVLFMVTSKSLSHTKARRDASEKGVRIASMPSVTQFSFTEGGLTADYHRVKELCDLIFEKVSGANTLRITSSNGTDIKMSIKGRGWIKDTGIFHKRGDFGNLPAGEVFVAPVEGTSNGIVVADKMGEFGENIQLTVENGYAMEIKGSEKLKEIVNKLGRKARNIAEFGIGANPKARVIGNILEDEKCMRTCHIALGGNSDFGGKTDVPFHKDGIIFKPRIEIDGKTKFSI